MESKGEITLSVSAAPSAVTPENKGDITLSQGGENSVTRGRELCHKGERTLSQGGENSVSVCCSICCSSSKQGEDNFVTGGDNSVSVSCCSSCSLGLGGVVSLSNYFNYFHKQIPKDKKVARPFLSVIHIYR